MGEIADMMLEGLLDEETGEYIGDANMDEYGCEAPGFPISYERERREGNRYTCAESDATALLNEYGKIACPACGKRVKPAGLSAHLRDVHDLA